MGLGSEVRDPEKTYSGSWMKGSKRHRIPDPDPQHCENVRILCTVVLYILRRGRPFGIWIRIRMLIFYHDVIKHFFCFLCFFRSLCLV
jgi:hypothetical protein